MIIDTSALVSILTGEPQADRLLAVAAGASRVRMSAATALEASVVLDSRSSPQQRHRLDDLLATLQVDIVAFDSQHWRIAREAYRDFGKGSGHPARLNLGDCFSYALHRSTGDPLLYVGEDFAAAGVEPVPLG